MELQLTPALLRLDKKCGKSGIADNRKCSKTVKTTSPEGGVNKVKVAGAVLGGAVVAYGLVTAKDARSYFKGMPDLPPTGSYRTELRKVIKSKSVPREGRIGELALYDDLAKDWSIGDLVYYRGAKDPQAHFGVYAGRRGEGQYILNAGVQSDKGGKVSGIISVNSYGAQGGLPVVWKKVPDHLQPKEKFDPISIRERLSFSANRPYDFDLVENNCEAFARMVVSGQPRSVQVERFSWINKEIVKVFAKAKRNVKKQNGAMGAAEMNQFLEVERFKARYGGRGRAPRKDADDSTPNIPEGASDVQAYSIVKNHLIRTMKKAYRAKLMKTDSTTTVEQIRADKKCGKSGIAKGKKCGKPTSRMQTAAKVALGVGLLTGGAYLAKRRFMSMDEWRNSPLSARNKPKLTAQQAQQISDEAIAGGKVWDVQEKLNARRFQIECGGGLGKISALAKLDAAIRAPRCQAGEGAFGTYFVHPSEKYGIKLFRDAGDDVQWEFDHLDRARYAGVNAPEPLNTNAILDADGEVKAQTLIIGHMKGYKTINDLYHHPYGYATNAPDIVKVKLARQFRKLHTEGLAHGDIHSGNMMAHPRSHKVALIDFGYSTALDDYNPHKNIDGIDNLQQDLRRLPRFLGFEENAADDFIKRHEGVLDNIRTQAQDYNRSWEKYELAIKRYHDALERELLWDERRPRSRFVRSVTQPRIPGMTRRILTANAPTQIREALLIMKPTPFKQVAENLGLAPHRMHLALKPERDALRARQRAQPFGSPIRADKKCGASGIPDGQKCSKRTALRAAVGGALGLTALGVGIAAMTRRKGSIPRPGAPGIGRLAPRPTAGPPGGGGVSRVSVRDITRRPSATLPPTASPRTLALPGSPAPRALLPAAKPRLSKTARMRANTRAAEKLAEGQIAQTAREEIRRIGQIGNTMAATGEAAGMRVKTTVREVRLRLEAARRRFEPGYRAPGDGIKIPKALKASSSRSLPPSATPISSPIPFTPRPQAPERLRLGKTVAQVRQRRSQSGRRQTK